MTRGRVEGRAAVAPGAAEGDRDGLVGPAERPERLGVLV